jgi:hypothetical protein
MSILLQLNLIAAIIYCAATGFTKVSVLVFYLRIFPSRNFHIAVWTIVFIAAGYSIASILANIFSCNPIAKSWDLTITTGSCMNRPVFYFANAGLGIFTDFTTVAVPMYVTPRETPMRVSNRIPSDPGFVDCKCPPVRRLLLALSWLWDACKLKEFHYSYATPGTNDGQSSVGIVSCIRLGSLYTLLKSTDLTCKTYILLSRLPP